MKYQTRQALDLLATLLAVWGILLTLLVYGTPIWLFIIGMVKVAGCGK